MQLSRYGALMGFLGYAAAEVSPAAIRSQEKEVRSSSQTCSYDLGKSWTDETLYSG